MHAGVSESFSMQYHSSPLRTKLLNVAALSRKLSTNTLIIHKNMKLKKWAFKIVHIIYMVKSHQL